MRPVWTRCCCNMIRSWRSGAGQPCLHLSWSHCPATGSAVGQRHRPGPRKSCSCWMHAARRRKHDAADRCALPTWRDPDAAYVLMLARTGVSMVAVDVHLQFARTIHVCFVKHSGHAGASRRRDPCQCTTTCRHLLAYGHSSGRPSGPYPNCG
jgi:hypothetical protein